MLMKNYTHILKRLVRIVVTLHCLQVVTCVKYYTKEDIIGLREQVRNMFYHAYEGYLKYAFGYDELRPLTCDGVDTWGSYSLTLIDALDTLVTMGNYSEFRRVALLLEEKMDFDKDINVSVFETNIRIVGGLLSAHLLSRRAGVVLEEGWPCQGPLLRMAENVARRLLPAFDTATGMPYGTVNLRYGVPKGETPITCTAGIGTFLVEFGALSRLTGNEIYEEVALNAVYSLWNRRSPIGLFGNHIDVQSGRWTALDSGIGAGVDSLFEYLVKGSILLNRPDLLEMFHEARQAIDKYLRHDGWYIWANMVKGQMTLPVFQSLEAFWPGILSIIGDTTSAIEILKKYSSLWRKYGFLPEFYNVIAREASPNRESYPLRPELAESLMYLYQATKNQFMIEIGERMVDTIEYSAKTKCGYATIRNVITHEKENRMESFFLSETTKYLFLLFDEDNFLHTDGLGGDTFKSPYGYCKIDGGAYIFNTEAHPIDMSALYCCHDIKEDIFDGMDFSIFSEDAMLKMDRERYMADDTKNAKYQCGYKPPTQSSSYKNQQQQHHQQQQTNANDGDSKKKHTDSGISVDIEVFDDHNNPAAKILVENFEKIKKKGHTDSEQQQEKNIKRNQLTVTDIDDFFNKNRSDFQKPIDVLKYVIDFMHNFTLDAGFISGLQIFDKNVSAILGTLVQKEYEERTRTLWDLYELKVKYAINAELIKQLKLTSFNDENTEYLENILTVLYARNIESIANDAQLNDIIENIKSLSVKYQQMLVNTTAIQEFVLKILINGTTDKKRNFDPLLNEMEIAIFVSTDILNDAERRKELFAIARRIIEFKKRMIETFQKLQTLVNEDDAAKEPSQATIKNEDNESSAKETQTTVEENDKIITQQQDIKKPIEKIVNEQKANTPNKDEKAEDGDSVWSQLVQTILRKTKLKRTEFDEASFRLKTKDALRKYANKPMKYELFQCPKATFIESITHRDSFL